MVWTALLSTYVHCRNSSESQTPGRFLARLALRANVLLEHARGFVSGLLPDLELRNSVAEGSGGETAAEGVGAEAAEVADAGTP